MARVLTLLPTILAATIACATHRLSHPVSQPRIIPHTEWQTQPVLGYAADATRRNAGSGDSLAFRGLTVAVLETSVDSSGAKPVDLVRLRLTHGAANETRVAREGSAFNWNGFHVAVVAIY